MRSGVSRVGLALALTLGLTATPSMAQQGGPIRLAPLAPATERTPETGRPANPDSRAQPRGVVVEGLGTLSGDALGLLGEESGGLGDDMWLGSHRSDALRLLRNLPETYPYREGYALARRVLSSAARPPSGGREGSGILAPRISKLAAIGAGEDALRLATAAGGVTVPEHLAESAVRARFSRGALDAGCAQLRGYDGGYASAFWQQALIVCQVAQGDPGQAALGLDLMREQGIAVDPLFADAALQASGGNGIEISLPGDGEASELTTPDLMTLALWLAARADIPDAWIDVLDPGLLPALLADAEMDPDLRLKASHRALRAGMISGPDAVAVYRELDVDDAAVAAGLVSSQDVSEHRLLAYLYLAAAGRSDAIGRSEALWEAWTRARTSGGFDVIALTTTPLLEAVPVTPDFGWLSGAATEVALMAGDDERALDWYRLVLRQAPIVPDLARAAAALWPPMRAIGRTAPGSFDLTANTGATSPISGRPLLATPPRGPVPWSASRLERWIDLAGAEPGAGDPATVLAVLAALGDNVDDNQWRIVPLGGAGPATMPDAAVIAGLSRASQAGRKAETVLYALYALGQSGDRPHASVIDAVVRALSAVGVNDAAQALAREAIVAEAFAAEPL